MIQNINYKEQIQNGIKLLNEKVPNWRNVINLEELDLYSCTNCVLGQVYGGYRSGLHELNLSKKSSEHYGFRVSDVDNIDHSYATDYEQLTQEWLKELSHDPKYQVNCLQENL